jgi:hypothetical protein
METRDNIKGNLYRDIFFSEDKADNLRVLKHIHVEISRQNSNLTEVKDRMVKEALNAGANAIVNFKYGQRKHKLFSLQWDSESWHGEGDAVVL